MHGRTCQDSLSIWRVELERRNTVCNIDLYSWRRPAIISVCVCLYASVVGGTIHDGNTSPKTYSTSTLASKWPFKVVSVESRVKLSEKVCLCDYHMTDMCLPGILV